MQPSIQLKNQAADWLQTKRVKVGQTVQHRNAYWSNATGVNSEPEYTNTDWVFICEAVPYFRGMKITKSLTNTGKGLQSGDTAKGFWATDYFFEGIFNSGDPTQLSNWRVFTEEPI